MAIRVQITPEMRKSAALVKPGWYATLIKRVYEELNAKKDNMNTVLECEIADSDSEFQGVTCKHWLSEKAARFQGNLTSYSNAFNPKADPNVTLDWDVEDTAGRYIYAKWEQQRGKDGTDPPQNRIVDWAPLPKKWAKLADAKVDVSMDIESFETA